MNKTILVNFEGWKAWLVVFCAIIGLIDLVSLPFLVYFGKVNLH